MAIPLVIAGVSASIGAIFAGAAELVPEAAKDIAKEEFMRLVMGDVSDLEKEVIQAAFTKLGLDIDPEEGINATTITQAINNGPLASTGIELTNIFDREAIKKDMQKLALAYAAQSMGIKPKSLKADDVKDAVREYVSEMVIDEISNGNPEWLEEAKDLVAVVQMISEARRLYKEIEPGVFAKPELSNHPAAVSNRERQAKYRANHKRKWEPK